MAIIFITKPQVGISVFFRPENTHRFDHDWGDDFQVETIAYPTIIGRRHSAWNVRTDETRGSV